MQKKKNSLIDKLMMFLLFLFFVVWLRNLLFTFSQKVNSWLYIPIINKYQTLEKLWKRKKKLNQYEKNHLLLTFEGIFITIWSWIWMYSKIFHFTCNFSLDIPIPVVKIRMITIYPLLILLLPLILVKFHNWFIVHIRTINNHVPFNMWTIDPIPRCYQ